MSQISDEIVELIDKNRLDDLKKIKDQMTEKDYNQSVYHIIASKDEDPRIGANQNFRLTEAHHSGYTFPKVR